MEGIPPMLWYCHGENKHCKSSIQSALNTVSPASNLSFGSMQLTVDVCIPELFGGAEGEAVYIGT